MCIEGTFEINICPLGLPGGSVGKNTSAGARAVLNPGQEGRLEEEMAAHPRILARRIPWTGSLRGCISRGHSQTLAESLTVHVLTDRWHLLCFPPVLRVGLQQPSWTCPLLQLTCTLGCL